MHKIRHGLKSSDNQLLANPGSLPERAIPSRRFNMQMSLPH